MQDKESDKRLENVAVWNSIWCNWISKAVVIVLLHQTLTPTMYADDHCYRKLSKIGHVVYFYCHTNLEEDPGPACTCIGCIFYQLVSIGPQSWHLFISFHHSVSLYYDCETTQIPYIFVIKITCDILGINFSFKNTYIDKQIIHHNSDDSRWRQFSVSMPIYKFFYHVPFFDFYSLLHISQCLKIWYNPIF